MTAGGISRSLTIAALLSAGIITVLTACTDDPISGPGFTCDVTNPVAGLFLEPGSTVVLVHSPARETDIAQLKATATNRLGNARTDVPIKFVSSDTTVATVDSVGIVHARKPGSTRISASTCGKNATSQVTVALIAITVELKLDTSAVVAGDSLSVSAQAIAQDASTIPGSRFTFVASPAAGITIVQKTDSTALIKTSASGTFTITAAGEGASGSASVLVVPRVFVGALAGGEGGLDVGRDFGCGLIPLGRLYCWGLNGSTQLGAAADSSCFEEGNLGPSTSACSLLPIRVGPKLSFSSVSAGDGFACGIVSNGSAYCWGDGAFGKLGNGKEGTAASPGLVTSGLFFTAISVGGNHVCGIATGNAAYCWGQDSAGQLGDARHVNSTTPIPVLLDGRVATFGSIRAGIRHTCALQADGAAFCWGSNQDGQLGTGGFNDIDSPVAVVGSLRFTSISAGGDTVSQPPLPFRYESHTCGIAVGGAAYCWGSNVSGQLGAGSVGGSFTAPVAVAGGLTFAKISAGERHTCGLTTAGAVYCWGRNFDLQLGRGPDTGGSVDSGTPQLVTGGELPAGVTFTTISAGARHSCAVGSDGAAYCWGSNIFGALGNTLQAAFRGFPRRVATPK